jgi:hypothetical protein
MGLALAATAWFMLSAAAAPAPTPPSEGPIAEALALRGVLGKTPPPSVTTAVLAENGVLEMATPVLVPQVQEVAENTVGPDGKVVVVKRLVSTMVSVPRVEQVKVDGLKFYIVSKDGKLDPIDSGKATGMLKKKSPVLTGESADVDPQGLELVKAGTLYIVVPAPQPPAVPQPFAPPPPFGAKP